MTSKEENDRARQKVLNNYVALTRGEDLPADDEPATPAAPATDPSDADDRGYPNVPGGPTGGGGGRYYGVPNAPQ